jgi:hypothetical protein
MISSNIDGSSTSGSSQLFEMLALIANPDVYSQRLKELQDATEANKKYVELVAPASDILSLRDKAQSEALAASQALKDAKAEAAAIAAAAKAAASESDKAAKKKAKDIIGNAEARMAEVVAEKEASALVSAELERKLADAEALNSRLLGAEKDLANAIAMAKDAQLSAEAYRNSLVTKHRAFIEELMS